MWGDLADDLHRIAPPAAWKKDPALYKPYAEALNEMREPILTRYARPAVGAAAPGSAAPSAFAATR